MMTQASAAPLVRRQDALVVAHRAVRMAEIFRTCRDIPQTRREKAAQVAERMGWLMGLEPTTTGITIRDSTN